MGKYIDQLNVRYETDNPDSTILGKFKTTPPHTDTANTDTTSYSVSNVSVSATPLRLNKYTDGIKAADSFKYVACVNCTNLEKGYCTAWGHRPDVPEYEIRLCNKFKQEQRIH